MTDVRDRYREAYKETRANAREYWMNAGFLAGHQWIYWDSAQNRIQEQPRDQRLRPVINRMATNHRTIISNLTQRELSFDVMPSGADDASLQAAYISEEILRYIHDDHNWEGLREDWATAALKGGTAAISLDWDTDLDDSTETVLSIAEFVVEPGTRKAEQSRWWIKAQVLPPGEVQATYGLSKAPDADATRGLNPLQQHLLATHTGRDYEVDLTLVLTYYERPNPENEKGRVAVDVGGELVYDEAWPFPFTTHLNLFVGVETAVENQWMGDTIYTQARSPQVSLNLSKAKLLEHLRDAAAARLLVPSSALRTLEAFDDVPGKMYPYADGLEKPSWLQPPQLPGWIQGMPNDWAGDIDDIMGVHDVSRGRAPGSLESGTAVSILAEMDGSPVGRLTKETARLFSRLASAVLQLHEVMSSEQRLGVIETPAGPLGIEWTGSDIAGQTRVNIPIDSIRPRSRAAMIEVGNRMLEMGHLKDVMEWARFVEAPNQRDIVTSVAPAIAKARREHTQFAKGRPVIPATFDDHAAHIKEHNDFRMTPAYERLSEEDRQKVDLHIEGHSTLAAEEAATMANRAAADPALAEVPDPDGALPPAAAADPSALMPAEDPGTVMPDPAMLADDLMSTF